MINNDHKLEVFLCYSSEDKFAVRDFYNRLSAESWLHPWLDEEEILPGMNWEVEIEKAVEKADAVIVFLSHNSVHKEGYVHYELKLVLDIAARKPETTIFVIPVKLDECEVPLRIRSLQYIDYSVPETRDQAYSRLLKSLKIKRDMVNRQTGRTQTAHVVSSQNIQTEPDITSLRLDGFDLVRIPKGRFVMGSKASNTLAQENEIPQCPCTIPYDYWLSRFPISNEQFSEFAVSTKYIAALPNDWRKRLNHPIVNISWHDAVLYTHWLNEVLGKEIPNGTIFRLPTEAEWERASRGDSGFEWPWGSVHLDKLLERDTSAQKMKKEIEILRCTLNIVDVGHFSPFTDSPCKVADMMGSIIEWTQSLYVSYPYDAHDGRENLETEGERVLRGCFTSNAERFSVRSARRASALPDRKAPVLGFRIVIAPSVL